MEFYDSLISPQANDRLTQLAVQHSSEKSCWVALPPALISKLYEAVPLLPLVLELRTSARGQSRDETASQSWHVAWSGNASRGQHLEVPGALAGCLGIAQGITVTVRAVPDIPEAIGVCVEPISVDDWEVVEQNAGHMEDQILTQVGVVQTGQAFPFWVRQQSVLYLKVTTAHPASLVRLVTGAEVAVAPRPRRALHQQNQVAEADLNRKPADALQEQQQGGECWLRLQGVCTQAASIQCRLDISAEGSSSGLEGSTACTTCIYISRQTAKQAMLAEADLVLVSRNHPRSSQHVLSIKISSEVATGHAKLPEAILQSLKLKQHGRLRLQSITSATQLHPRAIVLHPIPYTPEKGKELNAVQEWSRMTEELSQHELKRLLAAWLAAQASLLAGAEEVEHVPIQQSTVVQLTSHADGATDQHKGVAFKISMKQPPSLHLSPGATYALLSAADLAPDSSINVSQGGPVVAVQDYPCPQPASAQLVEQQAAILSSSEALHTAASSALKHLLPLLAFPCRAVLQRLRSPFPGGLLLSGPPGCGKTGLAHLLATILQHHHHTLTHIVTINCQDIANDSPSNIIKHLIPKIQEALDCMPSLLILDDLHLICPAPGDSPDNANASGNGSAALVEWLCSVLDHFRPAGKPTLPVVVLGSCSDPGQLAAPLRAPGYLDHAVALPAPGAEERASMLASHLSARGAQCDAASLQAVAGQAEGYDAADLRVLADRAMHAAARHQLAFSSGAARRSPGPLVVSASDLAEAQQGFQPAAAWGVGHLQGGGGGIEGWQDVGGLADVQAALQEALELPTKYAALISRAPLRLRTGVLLYGPPGCGKTHIVAAAVAAAGMRLVSVKGPEVLNKYIGASEAAVRDLFRRAQAAAPCVMFFDEFDAIAPQRGHDSTGVTDRVVNQLLTQLDGVEGLTGVCVLAATSRPDLLDAALLRPGRLDRLIYCGFPDNSERGQILQALARRLRLDERVDLLGVGRQCEGYSGADLSALLSEAQLAAVHERLDSDADTETAATPTIMARHIQEALGKASPSVPPAERRRLESVYTKFSNNRDPNIGGADHKNKQIATLA